MGPSTENSGTTFTPTTNHKQIRNRRPFNFSLSLPVSHTTIQFQMKQLTPMPRPNAFALLRLIQFEKKNNAIHVPTTRLISSDGLQ
jgi:hypothetical protein